jgi:transcriptional regulator
MQIKEAFALGDLADARAIVRAYPLATLVTPDLRATHMPCLLDEASGELTIVGHVARADPLADALGGPLLAVFTGPHGYVSASWYASDTIPTWNYVVLHLRGVPVLLADPLPVLRETVAHFEAAVAHPWSLDRMGETAHEMAKEVIAFRLRAEWWHAEAKLSQDKPDDERARIIAGLESDSAYANPTLAAAMRAARDGGQAL